MNLRHLAACVGALALAQSTSAAPPKQDAGVTATPTQGYIEGTDLGCVKEDGTGDPICAGFTGAEFVCPKGWKKAQVKVSALKTRCGPYEL